MRQAGKIIFWLSVVLIGLVIVKPFLLPLFHLQYVSPWMQYEAVVQRYLQLAFLVPFTLFGSLQHRRSGTRLLIIMTTITVMGGLIYFATRDLDKDLPFPTHTVKELFQSNSDPNERIILQAEDNGPDASLAKPAILLVKPYSREMQIVHAADTNHLDEGKWKRIY